MDMFLCVLGISSGVIADHKAYLTPQANLAHRINQSLLRETHISKTGSACFYHLSHGQHNAILNKLRIDNAGVI